MHKIKKYEIQADCKSYSRWSVDEKGDLQWIEHEFEGVDILSYCIVDISDNSQSDDAIFESESFEKVKKELKRLTCKK